MKAQWSTGLPPNTKPFVFSSTLIANIVLSTLGIEKENVEQNPAHAARPQKEDTGRVRFLTPNEE
jgi:hypothetical protein